MVNRLREWARVVRRDVTALWLAARDRRVPIVAKCVAASVAAYALSPIDLIPDFIPILGLIDDAIIVPLGILLAIRLIPPPVMAALRDDAMLIAARPVSRVGMVAVIAAWGLGFGLTICWIASAL